MRNRFILIAGLAALVAIAIPVSAAIAGETGTGPDGNTQSMEAAVSPKALYKKTFSPASLFVDVRTGTTNSTTGAPSPAVHDVIDFDQDLSLKTKGLPTCNSSKLQNTSTEAAERACGDAMIGSGEATTLLPLGTLYTEPTKVLAFNGVPQGGKPVVLLQVYGASPNHTAIIMLKVSSIAETDAQGQNYHQSTPPIAG